MVKKYFYNAVLCLVAALPCVAVGVLVGNWTRLWVFETWSEILYTYIGISIVIFLADKASKPFFKKKS